MKSVQYDKHGGPEVLIVKDIEKPSIAATQVLVENYAASINPFDHKVRSGKIFGLPSEFPITIGGDFSGRIIGLGAEVMGFQIGDDVYGQASVFGGASGSFAEYLAAHPKSIYKKPENLDYYESAALPLVGSSAIQAIEDYINLKKGQKILIQGGSGGIGSIAIQIAKVLGSYVATTVSTESIEFAKSLGADKIIDYKKENFYEIIKDFDAIFDTTGKKIDNKSFESVRKEGIIVSMTEIPEELVKNDKDIKTIGQNSEVTADRLERLKSYVENMDVKPLIDKQFSLDEARKAYEYQENEHPKGKVVIKIK